MSGVQPTGSIHLGNYLGAIKNWIPLQVVLTFLNVNFFKPKLEHNIIFLLDNAISSD